MVGRGAIIGGVAAALVVGATVAFGAGTDVRIHRLHVPPPPTVPVEGGGDISRPVSPGSPKPANPSDPSAPVTPSPPASPVPPVTPSPPPATGVQCTFDGGAGAPDLSATLQDFVLSTPTLTLPAAATLHFRGMNQGAVAHSISIRLPGAAGASLCPTPAPSIAAGATGGFSITNLQPGSYVVYCTIHPASMQQPLTITG